MSALGLGWHIMKERMGAGRMMVIWPLLTIFILFASWGLSDPNNQSENVRKSALARPLGSSFLPSLVS